MSTKMDYKFLEQLTKGIPLDPLPEDHFINPSVPHAPVRNVPLNSEEKELAVKNALRYFPPKFHLRLSVEFKMELDTYGHIYMYRFTPRFPIKAYPIDAYPAKIQDARAIMLMIFNNLDPALALYPQELVVYGGNGQVLANWAQFWVLMKYLSEMSDTHTIPMYSGHPLGLFPAGRSSPRVVITNGMMIPNYSSHLEYDRMFAMGVTMFGQMSAGSYCYIGPQGTVHGTTITLLNAGRKYLNSKDLRGKVYVSAGLGGMSGSQAKAACIAGCVGVLAEVNLAALEKRLEQGWLVEMTADLDRLIERIREARRERIAISIGYHGNIVTLWERLAEELERSGEFLVDIASDQTSLHNPYNGGYYPVQLSFEESQKMMMDDPTSFKELVQESLRRQVTAIRKLAGFDGGKGKMKFWDYGNAFLLEASRANANVLKNGSNNQFIFPTFIEDIIGEIFSLGFGPFRWVCCSDLQEDLAMTDKIAEEVIQEILNEEDLDDDVRARYEENLKWIQEAGKHKLVVGSQARILYSDLVGRSEMARRFNESIKSGKIKGPVVISRDHFDVSGADSPFRETCDIQDGSKFTADMAVQNFIGDGIRGATWVALHNGGGVGWGEAIHGGFGLVLNGENSDVAVNFLLWDINNGIARRAWSGNKTALKAIKLAMKRCPQLKITLPNC